MTRDALSDRVEAAIAETARLRELLVPLLQSIRDEHEDFHREYARGYGRAGVASPIEACKNEVCKALVELTTHA